MSDIEVTIAARNEASKVIRDFSQEVTNSMRGIELSLSSMASKALGSFDSVAKSIQGLGTSLRVLSGGDGAAGGLAKLGKEMEHVFGISEASLINQMAAALRKGANVDELDDMTKAATGLAHVFGTDLAGGMRRIQDAMEGNYGPLKSFTEVLRVSEEGLREKAKSAMDAANADERLALALGNVSEAIGKIMDPIRDVFADSLNVVADAINKHMVPAVENLEDAGVEFANKWTDVSKLFADSTAMAMSFGETAFFDFGKVVRLTMMDADLAFEQFRSFAEHVFVDLFPSYVGNALGTLGDMAQVTERIFVNVSKNIGTMGAALWLGIRDAPKQSDVLSAFGGIANYGEYIFNVGSMGPEQAAKILNQNEALRLKMLKDAKEVHLKQFEGIQFNGIFDGFVDRTTVSGRNPDGSRVVSELEKQLTAKLDEIRMEVFGKNLGAGLKFGFLDKNERSGRFDFNIDLAEKARRGSGGMDRELKAFQHDTLLYAPTAPGPDKILEELRKQTEQQKKVEEAIKAMDQKHRQYITIRPID